MKNRKYTNLRKETILFRIGGGKKWIGGVYYFKSIIYMIINNQVISNKYTIVVLIDKKIEKEFSCFSSSITIKTFAATKMTRVFQMLKIFLTLNIKYIYNYHKTKFDFYFKKKGIFWIPDFQDKYFEEFFSSNEISSRNERYKYISSSKNKLVLSSNNALSDYNFYYPTNISDSIVVHFISYIEPEIKSISQMDEKLILSKFSLTKNKYFCISNQFWKHKNHIIIFKMIRLLKDLNFLNDYSFVFTGNLVDNRNLEYYNELVELTNDSYIQSKISILGFMDRKEQIIIMKNSRLVIQPSLFEGWGTVLEDSKVLNKQVLLSNIPVHLEQMNENCFLFDPYDERNMLDVLLETLKIKHTDNVFKGVQKMKVEAKKYSKNLEKVFF